MTPKKFDGVVEAVRYNSVGQLDLVRVYERVGDSFSDRRLYDRDGFLKKLKNGKRFLVGKRTLYMASTFETGDAVRLVGERTSARITTGQSAGEHDHLEGTPLF